MAVKPPAIFKRACLEWMPRLMADFAFDKLDAAAVMGNAGHESNGLRSMQEKNPTVAGSKGGLGPFQWTGPRRRAFEAWLKKAGDKAPEDLDASYAFLYRELIGPEKKAVPATKAAEGLLAKVVAFEMAYERAGVKHYTTRMEWAQAALAIYEAAQQGAPAKPKGNTISPVPIVTTVAPLAETMPWWKKAIGYAPPVNTAPPPSKGDPVLYRMQKQLLAAGFPEVGEPDGLWGENTKAALKLLRDDQAPDLEVPDEPPLTDAMIAAVARAKPRKVSAGRAATTVQDLREAGNTPVKAPVSLTFGGGLLGLFSLFGGADQTGVLDKVKGVTDQASNAIQTTQTILTSIVTVTQWLFHHWWLIGVVAGIWAVAKGLKWALQIRALYRQGTIRQAGL